jgi:hypothetical protein
MREKTVEGESVGCCLGDRLEALSCVREKHWNRKEKIG